MPYQPEGPLDGLSDSYRSDAAMRRESLGPIVEAVGVLRAYCETLRPMLDEIDLSGGVHLELLAAVVRTRDGSRWWGRLSPDTSDEVGER
jgi:hypothetical protein